MKRILSLLILSLCLQVVCAQSSQAYSDDIYLESSEDNFVFIVKGKSTEKKEVEANAQKAVIYNILYRGVDGVEDGKPIITANVKEKKSYTADFFNSAKKYENYVKDVKSITKTEKNNGSYQCTYKVTMGRNLMRDLHKNAIAAGSSTVTTAVQNFSIMVVPMKKNKNDSYVTLYNKDRNLRTAATMVQEAFGRFDDIETRDVTLLEEILERMNEMGEVMDAATSNEEELLKQSGTDVIVKVDLEIIKEEGGLNKASINLTASETSTGANWASGNFVSNATKTNDTAGLCAEALKGAALKQFVDRIKKEFAKPISVSLVFKLSNEADFTFLDRDSNGKRLSDKIKELVKKSSHGQVSDPRITSQTGIIYDNFLIQRTDAEGNKVTVDDFATKLTDELWQLGIDCDYNVGGKTINIVVRTK